MKTSTSASASNQLEIAAQKQNAAILPGLASAGFEKTTTGSTSNKGSLTRPFVPAKQMIGSSALSNKLGQSTESGLKSLGHTSVMSSQAAAAATSISDWADKVKDDVI